MPLEEQVIWLLRVEDVTVKYGVIPAVQNLSMEVRRGQIVALLGANGAGKTTTLKTVVGVLRPAEGRIFYDGRDITHLSAPQRVRLGISLVPVRVGYPESTNYIGMVQTVSNPIFSTACGLLQLAIFEASQKRQSSLFNGLNRTGSWIVERLNDYFMME